MHTSLSPSGRCTFPQSFEEKAANVVGGAKMSLTRQSCVCDPSGWTSRVFGAGDKRDSVAASAGKFPFMLKRFWWARSSFPIPSLGMFLAAVWSE